MLEMDLTCQVVETRFRGAVGCVRKGDGLHGRKTAGKRSHTHEFRKLALLQQRQARLKENKWSNGVGGEMLVHVLD